MPVSRPVAALGAAVIVGGLAAVPAATPAAAAPTAVAASTATSAAPRGAGARATKYLGTSASIHPWHSGAWVGGYMSAARAARWGTWRGTPSDITPVFPDWNTWKGMNDPTWEINTYKGFRGRLLYGMPILPRSAKPADLPKVASGAYDATYRHTARELKRLGRGNSVVRVGWEANGTWMPYSVTARTAPQYRAAYRRVRNVMKKEAPGLVFSFDVNCGTQLRGQTNRLDSLTRLYPGNDVVDLVGCSAYDWDVIGATNETQWKRALKPSRAVGLGDVAAFARTRGKGFAVPEWGLAAVNRDGHGDNPFYITKMKQFFVSQSDVLVLESYFNEGGTDMRSSIWPESPDNPRSGAVYRKLW